MKKNKKLRSLTEGAMIAAIYGVLTLVFWQFSSMQIQVRVSEALCILPLFTPAAVPGLTVGCFLANMLMGNVWDAVFGSFATLLAAAVAYKLKDKRPSFHLLGPLACVVFNALIVPLVLYFGYGVTTFGNETGTWLVLGLQAVSVAIGQVIACYGLGMPLYYLLKRTKLFDR